MCGQSASSSRDTSGSYDLGEVGKSLNEPSTPSLRIDQVPTGEVSIMEKKLDLQLPEMVQQYQTLREVSEEHHKAAGSLLRAPNFTKESANQAIGVISVEIQKKREMIESEREHVKHILLKSQTSKEEKSELEKESQYLLRQRNRISDQIEVLTKRSHELKAQFLYALSSDERHEFIEELLADPGYRKRKNLQSKGDRKVFADKALRHLYPEEALQGPREDLEIWCPVSRQMWDPYLTVAAHVIPPSMDLAALGKILSEGELDYSCDPTNCIYMIHDFEVAFDKGVFVLVPVAGTETAVVTEYQIALVDKAQRNTHHKIVLGGGLESSKTYGDLDGVVLQFPHPTRRPRKRYMYIRFVMGLLAARRLQFEGFTETVAYFPGNMWPTPGKWVRKPMMPYLAGHIGQTTGQLMEDIGDSGFEEPGSSAPPPEEAKKATQQFFDDAENFFLENEYSEATANAEDD